MMTVFYLRAVAFLGSWIGRGVLVASVLSAGFVWRQMDKAALKQQGRVEVVLESKAAGAEKNAKSEKIRKEAAKPGAAKRLQSDPLTCVDC
jgi:hypothetical protein